MTEVRDLETMDRSVLAALWTRMFKRPVPAKMSQPMQRRFLAHALQVARFGDLPSVIAARLDRIAAGGERKASLAMKPGSRLLRTWNSVTHAFATLIARSELGCSTVKLFLDGTVLSAALDLVPGDLAPDVLNFTAPLTLARRGIEARIVAGEALSAPDATLIRVLAKARNWAKALREGVSLTELAARTGHSEPTCGPASSWPSFRRACSRPSSKDASPGLTVTHLVREPLPLDWDEQHHRLAAL